MLHKITLVAACLIASQAQASRSCLDHDRAARTWPTRPLAIDDDGCFTYMRPGLRPVPAATKPATNEVEKINTETATALDMAQRWPTEPWGTLVRIERPAPMMHPRDMVTLIFSVVLFCAVFEVAFGGFLTRNRS